MRVLSTAFLIARLRLVRVARSKRFLLCLGMAFLPTLIAFAITSISRARHPIPGQNLATHLGWLLLLQVLLPVISLIAGSAVIAEEVEDRTLTYLFSRPIDRSGVFLGRWFAFMAATLFVLVIGAVAMLWVASHGAPPAAADAAADWIDDIALPLLEAVALGSLVYTALFAMLGVLTRRPVIIGLAYSFAIEGFFANLPGKTQALTVQYHLRSWISGSDAVLWTHVEGFDSTSFESRTAVLVISGLVLAFALGYGAWLVRRKEFVVSA